MSFDKPAPILRVNNISKDEFDEKYLNKGSYGAIGCYHINSFS